MQLSSIPVDQITNKKNVFQIIVQNNSASACSEVFVLIFIVIYTHFIISK